jgi:hypothetical protein
MLRTFAADAGLPQLVYEASSENNLRIALSKTYPFHPIEKFKAGETEVICVMPRLKGGGEGVRSILLYYGSDEMGGWELMLHCSTFSSDIMAKVENGVLVFCNVPSKNVIMKIPLTPEFLGRIEETNPRINQ